MLPWSERNFSLTHGYEGFVVIIILYLKRTESI